MRTVEQRLVSFGSVLLAALINGSEPDAPEIETVALRDGLLLMETMRAPCRDGCACAVLAFPLECIQTPVDVKEYLERTVTVNEQPLTLR